VKVVVYATVSKRAATCCTSRYRREEPGPARIVDIMTSRHW